MDDKPIRVGSDLLEALNSLDVRGDLRALSVRQARMDEDIKRLSKGLDRSSSEKAALQEAAEERKELEREALEALVQVEKKLEGVEKKIESVDGVVSGVAKKVETLEEGFGETQAKVDALFAELDKLKAEYRHGSVERGRLKGTDETVS